MGKNDTIAYILLFLIGIICSYNFSATAQLSSQETWNSSAPPLNAMEQRQFEKFLEMGEEAYKKECYKSLGIGNEFAEDILDYMPDDLSKDVCDARIKEFKNLTTTGTGESGANQSSTLGQVTYETYSDNTDGFSLEYPSDWHVRDGDKGLNVYKGTRGFSVSVYDDPQISLIDTYDFGRLQFKVYDEDNKYKITDELAELNIDDKPALSFSYSVGGREIMATALIHNNVGYLFEYETLKENFDSDIDMMTRFLGTIRFTS